MKTEKTIEALNSLITIHNDRIEGYETAYKETDELDLKSLFAQFIATSQKCRQELVKEVNTLGGEVAEGSLTSGKFFRVWMDVKVALTGKDRQAIIKSCEYGEDKARDTYNVVLADDLEHLTSAQITMISSQKALHKVDHDLVKALCNALAQS